MAKRGRRILPARKTERHDDSLLIRSAESLGRVIGSLQRQMQGRSKRITAIANDVVDAIPNPPRLKNPFASSARSSSGARKRSTRKATAASKTTGSRKRSAARKSSKKR